MSTNKKYGLILPEKSNEKPSFIALYNVFGKDSDSEEDNDKKPYLLRPSKTTTRQTKTAVEKAIQEDPTVYQYDEVYDEIVSEKIEKKASASIDKKPKYIEKLIKTANKRKLENERRIERQIQKEREKEGDEFADKEVFVTSAYKKKLEDMKLEEEREKREEYLENIGDITKQADLGGFYRHLYEQKLGSEKKDSKEEKETELTRINKGKEASIPKKRQYRKRKSTDSNKYLSEGEVEDSDDEINHINLRAIKLAKSSKKGEHNIDADSDFLSDEENDDSPPKQNEKEDTESPPKILTSSMEPLKDMHRDEKYAEKADKHDKEHKQLQKDIKNENKPKIDIWKKRTVRDVFDQALKRYYERKAAKGL